MILNITNLKTYVYIYVSRNLTLDLMIPWDLKLNF